MDTDIAALTTVLAEVYDRTAVALMFLIHIGFCIYERAAKHAATARI